LVKTLRPAAIALCVTASCASARPVTAGATAAVGATASPPQELSFFVGAALWVVRGGRTVCALSADGWVTAGALRVGRIEPRRMVSPEGAVRFALEPDGTLRWPGSDRPARLLGDGTVVNADGATLRVQDDGAVVVSDPAHPHLQLPSPARVEGVAAATRATAALLVLAAMQREGAAELPR
jgi:hypothetical protein